MTILTSTSGSTSSLLPASWALGRPDALLFHCASLPLPIHLVCLSTRSMLQKAQETDYIDINCIDPLGRSALLMAIDNENLEMVELLINHNVDTKDALLHAISEEFVEAVEVLLDHEDSKLQAGGKHVNDTLLLSLQLSPATSAWRPQVRPWSPPRYRKINGGTPGEGERSPSSSCCRC